MTHGSYRAGEFSFLGTDSRVNLAVNVTESPFASVARISLGLGLCLLGLAATGGLLTLGRSVAWDLAGGALTLGVHVYLALLSLSFLGAKLLLVMRRLIRGLGGRLALPVTDRTASLLLVAGTGASYLSGLALTLNLSLPGGNQALKDLHLWASLLLALPLGWHLVRYLRPALQAVSLSLRRGTREELAAAMGRRRFVIAASALLVAPLARWAAAALQEEEEADANDFPVTTFYNGDARVDLRTYRLQITGAVDRPLALSYPELLRLRRVRARYPLECVTGWTVTRTWEGVPVMDLLDLAGARPGFTAVRFRSVTGYERWLGAPMVRRPGALVSTHVEGVPYTAEHGFPARLMVPGVIGEDNVKWLAEVHVVSAG